MKNAPSNIHSAARLIEVLASQGVREFCVCAGARNAPLVKVLEAVFESKAAGFAVKNFFDERAAAFYALGCAKRSGRPPAVVTTSGTAVAELLPAAVEAHYSGLPLVFVTADRPASYRGSAAPQAIDQVGIFSHYVARTYDLEAKTVYLEQLEVADKGVTHVNICFAEPLVDAPVPLLQIPNIKPIRNESFADNNTRIDCVSRKSNVEGFFSKVKSPLCVVSAIPDEFRGRVLEFLRELQLPAYIEATSGLREERSLANFSVHSGFVGLSAKNFSKFFDGVLRIGSVPTLRLWRDLDGALINTPVLSVHNLPFSGLARDHEPASAYDALFAFQPTRGLFADAKEYQSENLHAKDRFERLLKQYPMAEASWIHRFSEIIPASSLVFLGNSLPIREWDLAASFVQPHSNVIANRGANGIDGLISTFFGAASVDHENWLILGDLSALYDLNALAVADDNKRLRVVVVNNQGGRIFAPMFGSSKLFLNSHAFSFAKWAEMFGFEYLCCRSPADGEKISGLGNRAVVEILPDEVQSLQFGQEWGSM